MHIARWLSLILILLASRDRMIIADSTSEPASLKPLWALFKGRETVGGCDNHYRRLWKAYIESIKMVVSAIDALDFLGQGKPFKYTAESVLFNQERKEIQQWKILKSLIFSLFGVVVEEDGVKDKESKRRVKIIRGWFLPIRSSLARQADVNT